LDTRLNIEATTKNLIAGVQSVCRAQLPVLLATLIVCILCLFGDPLYQVNDDSFLAMVGGGFGVAVQPEPHLVWSHFGYGVILSALSRVIGPNAHGWVTIASIWLCLTLIIGTALRAKNATVGVCLFLVCFGCVYLSALLSAEFTITATVLFGSGIAMWLASNGQEKSHRFIWTTAPLTALVLAYLIRPDSYLMAFVIVGPALLYLCWRRTELTRRARLLSLLLVVIAAFGYASDKLVYWSSPDWRQVPQYFDLASNFTDFGRVPWRPNAPEYQQAGWSYDDYVMFSHWYTRHPIYSAENVSLLVKNLAVPVAATAPAQIWAWFTFAFRLWPVVLLLCAQALICLLLNKNHRFTGFLLIAGELAAITLAASTGKFLVDYIWEAAAATTLLGLCALWVQAPIEKPSLLRNLGLLLAAVIGISSGVSWWFEHQSVARDASEYRKWILQNRNLFDGKVTVWDSGMMWEWLITPTRIYAPFPELKVASIDDINSMPVETAALKELGIEDLAKELCTDPKMCLLCPRQLIGNLAGFCERHYGIKPIFKEAARWRYQGIYVLENPESPGTASK
jgi:hypothetical protein